VNRRGSLHVGILCTFETVTAVNHLFFNTTMEGLLYIILFYSIYKVTKGASHSST